jgi:HD-GYP domain-containing protein (c-di-GMP phosphodiesterase class II)
LVKTPSTLDVLKAKGILELEVDLSKSKLPQQTLGKNNSSESPEQAQMLSVHEHQASLVKAEKLYTQAKYVQQTFLTQLRSGSAPNLFELNELSQDIIESVFANSDALSCLLMLKNSNDYLVEHAINCAILLTIFAKYKGMSESEIEDLTIAGLLMDIGMSSLPSDLLIKEGQYSEDDSAIMRSHVDIGNELITRLKNVPAIVVDVIQNHHERIDGSGYPSAKTAPQISIYSQMASIVDCYDEMISNHKNKSSNSATFALQQLERDESLDNDWVKELIEAIGLHPVGSLVQLESKQLGIVSQRVPKHPMNPFVVVFYNLESQSQTEIQYINLSQVDDQIIKGIRPEEFGINLNAFFKQTLIP